MSIWGKWQRGGGFATSRPKETQGRNSFIFLGTERAGAVHRDCLQGAVVVHTQTANRRGQGRRGVRTEMQAIPWPLFLFLVLGYSVSFIVQIQAGAESKEPEGYTHRKQPSGAQSRAGKWGEELQEVKWRKTYRGAQWDFIFKKGILGGKKESIKSLGIISRSYFNSDSLWLPITPHRNMFFFPEFPFSLLRKKSPPQSLINL